LKKINLLNNVILKMDKLNQQALVAELKKTVADANENLARLQYLNNVITTTNDITSINGPQGGDLRGNGQPVMTWDAQGNVVFTGKVMYGGKELQDSFAAKDDLNRYALKSDISGFITRKDLPPQPNLTGFVQKPELDSLRKSIPMIPAGFDFGKVAQQSQLQPLQSEINQLKTRASPDLSIYALKSKLAAPKCVDRTTVANDFGGGNTIFLDRHNVQCNPNEVLSGFQLSRPKPNQIAYKYKCCSYN
jgi:hypothetical protein